jgi:hypothetical protein
MLIALPLSNLILDFVFTRKNLLTEFLRELWKLGSLRAFSINRNQVEDDAIAGFGASLGRLDGLRELTMSECRYSKAGLQSLSAHIR